MSMSVRERTRPDLGIIEPCLPSPAKGACLGTAWLRPFPPCLCRANQIRAARREFYGEGQMDGVKALAVLASIYYPGDGVVAENNYQTSSGERYDQSASKCAALQWP